MITECHLVNTDKVTAVPVRSNGNFQTPISVPVHTLSNPVHRQDYTVACLNYTLQTMMPLPGCPVMAPNAYYNNNIINTSETFSLRNNVFHVRRHQTKN